MEFSEIVTQLEPAWIQNHHLDTDIRKLLVSHL